MKNKPLQQFSLEEITDKYIGEKGSEKRDAFENELRLDLLGEALKQTRIKQKLTQEELGKLVGVQKSQISKLESSTNSASIDTIMKVFDRDFLMNADEALSYGIVDSISKKV